MNIDDIFEDAGDLGWQQLKYVLILCSFRTVRAMDMMAYIFLNQRVSFQCLMPNGSLALDNECPDNDKDMCARVVFDDENVEAGATLAQEWDLVCQDNWLVPLAVSIYVLGNTLGMPVLGSLSDKMGRKPAIFLSFSCMLITNQICAMAPTFLFYCIFRLLNGFFCAGVQMSNTVMATEIVGKSRRGTAAAIYTTGWAFGTMLICPLAYLFPQWRQMSLVITITGLPLLLLYSYLPESPRWLYNKNRLPEANAVIRTIIKGNGQTYKSRYLLHSANLAEEVRGRHSVKIGEFFHHQILLLIVISLTYAWMVIFDLSNALTMMAGEDSSNIYMSTAISGLVEVPGNYLGLYLLGHLGRKDAVAGILFCTGIGLFSVFFVSQASSLVSLIVMLGKMGSAACFPIFSIHLNEIFPTAIRNTAFGLVSFAARTGGMLFPYIVELGSLFHNLHYLVLGLMSVFAAGLNFYFLPETSGRPLPENTEDVFRLVHGRSY